MPDSLTLAARRAWACDVSRWKLVAVGKAQLAHAGELLVRRRPHGLDYSLPPKLHDDDESYQIGVWRSSNP